MLMKLCLTMWMVCGVDVDACTREGSKEGDRSDWVLDVQDASLRNNEELCQRNHAHCPLCSAESKPTFDRLREETN